VLCIEPGEKWSGDNIHCFVLKQERNRAWVIYSVVYWNRREIKCGRNTVLCTKYERNSAGCYSVFCTKHDRKITWVYMVLCIETREK